MLVTRPEFVTKSVFTYYQIFWSFHLYLDLCPVMLLIVAARQCVQRLFFLWPLFDHLIKSSDRPDVNCSGHQYFDTVHNIYCQTKIEPLISWPIRDQVHIWDSNLRYLVFRSGQSITLPFLPDLCWLCRFLTGTTFRTRTSHFINLNRLHRYWWHKVSHKKVGQRV